MAESVGYTDSPITNAFFTLTSPQLESLTPVQGPTSTSSTVTLRLMHISPDSTRSDFAVSFGDGSNLEECFGATVGLSCGIVTAIERDGCTCKLLTHRCMGCLD